MYHNTAISELVLIFTASEFETGQVVAKKKRLTNSIKLTGYVA